MSFDLNTHVKTLLERYLEVFTDEKNRFSVLEQQLQDNENLGTRKNFTGHVTASAYVLSPDKKRFAMIHNINLDKWLAPGGHWEEGDGEMYNNAMREVREETGLTEIDLYNWHKENNFTPIDIDTHHIPENPKKQEKEHYHHDFRYVFILKNKSAIRLQSVEVAGFKWLSIEKNDVADSSGNNVLEKIRTLL
ncbi:MAG: NUDIX domain-containing protein [Candidatus Gracilibacteria bacterium]|nr:NUDIX domain-containing protein [Candidatus Gracilibacteria bacterium]